MTEPNEPVQRHVEVDLRATDNDSTYGNELSTYTASLTSSVVDYRHENGRRYHGYHDGHYMMPNDEKEKERLDIANEMMLTMLRGELFLAPIGESPGRVLDLGTGTGIWAIDFADKFPNAEPSMVPPNVRFLVDDMEEDWVEDQPYNFIHSRYLAGSIKNFPKLLRQCYEHTAPGGWVEMQDWKCLPYSEDGSHKGTSIEQYYNVIIEAFGKVGIDICPGPQLEQWFREAGFVDVHAEKYRVPIGAWPKDKHLKALGTWNMLQAETGFEAAGLAVLTRNADWSPAEVSILVAKTNNDARNRDIHTLFEFYVVYGRKPE